MNSRLARTFLATSMLLSLSCRGDRTERSATIERTWPAGQVQSIELDSSNGSVELLPGATGVQLRAVVHVRGRDAQRLLRNGLLEIELENGRLEIRERDSERRNLNFMRFLKQNEARVEYRLVVPSTADIQISGVNGNVHSRGVGGKLEIETVNGKLDIDETSGEVSASTVNGRVRVAFDHDFGGAKLESVNGGIQVVLPHDASFHSDVSQVNGSFRTNVPMAVTSGEGDTRIEGINGGRNSLEISTVNGSIEITQRPEVAAQAH